MSGHSNLDGSNVVSLASVKRILTPGGCVAPQNIKSFLTMSRKFSDYKIHTDIPHAGPCNDYMNRVLFPAWVSREYVLDYCGFIANQAAENKLDELESSTGSVSNSADSNIKNPIDPRLDSYGNRDYGKKAQSVEDSIKSWVDQERAIEDIIRQDTTKYLQRKCGPSFLAMRPYGDKLPVNASTYEQAYEIFKATSTELYDDE